MNVAGLIELLRAQPPQRRVVLRGYENGYADVSGLRERPIKLDANPEWWNGPHEASATESNEVAIEIVRIDRDPE
ncbi:hypothetical protein [Bradyrhizobium yuanmingense]|uniref:hypothetical protein n=1 Tax=Bradyrhizobium yuanmingense TaxID=108015 RepID=UPI003516AB44